MRSCGVSTPDRLLYFKAEGLGGRHEPGLLRDLIELWPELVPEVLVFDDERCWMLMADHGRPMWDVLEPKDQLAVFEEILPTYAQLQRTSAAHIEHWIDLGAPDRRMTKLPELMDRLLAGEFYGGALPIEPNLRRSIDASLPALGQACDELAESPLPDALDHGDLHGGNILVGAGTPRLADWGDSCVTHPFSSLFVTYQLAFGKIDPSDRATGARRLRDIYLEAWTDLASADYMRRAFNLATWVAHVSRALDYVNMLEGSGPELVDEWHGFIVDTLKFWQERHKHLANGDDLIDSIVAQAYES